jgi:FSR family fosmidomycin resistance protein-like MFS transporter
MLIGVFGVAIAGLLVGFSQNLIMLLIFLSLMGIAGGGYHPAAAPLISASVKPKDQGRALGIHLIGGSGSFFLAPLIAAAIASSWGWQGPFITMAIPSAILGIVLYFLLGRWLSRQASQLPSKSNQADATTTTISWRHLITFMVLVVLVQGITFSIISFTPLFLVDTLSIGEEAAAAFLSIIYSAGVWVSPLGGWLSDRIGRVRVVLISSLLTGPLIFLFNMATGNISIITIMFFLGVMIYARMPSAESYIIKHSPVHRHSTILGIYYFASMEAGGIFTPLLGISIDRFGFYTSYTIASLIIIGLTLLSAIPLMGSKD